VEGKGGQEGKEVLGLMPGLGVLLLVAFRVRKREKRQSAFKAVQIGYSLSEMGNEGHFSLSAGWGGVGQ
jgi:hypothetical protein